MFFFLPLQPLATWSCTPSGSSSQSPPQTLGFLSRHWDYNSSCLSQDFSQSPPQTLGFPSPWTLDRHWDYRQFLPSLSVPSPDTRIPLPLDTRQTLGLPAVPDSSCLLLGVSQSPPQILGLQQFLTVPAFLRRPFRADQGSSGVLVNGHALLI